MPNFRWPRGPVLLLLLSILLILVPERWEGPVIYIIDDRHALTVLDCIAMIPVLISVTWIQRGIWKRRIYLFNKVTMYPGASVLIVFSMGLGLGMFFAAAFYSFRYWWAIGGIIFMFMLINVVLVSGHSKN